MRKNTGLTLIELSVVIAIIGVLASIAQRSFQGIFERYLNISSRKKLENLINYAKSYSYYSDCNVAIKLEEIVLDNKNYLKWSLLLPSSKSLCSSINPSDYNRPLNYFNTDFNFINIETPRVTFQQTMGLNQFPIVFSSQNQILYKSSSNFVMMSSALSILVDSRPITFFGESGYVTY